MHATGPQTSFNASEQHPAASIEPDSSAVHLGKRRRSNTLRQDDSFLGRSLNDETTAASASASKPARASISAFCPATAANRPICFLGVPYTVPNNDCRELLVDILLLFEKRVAKAAVHKSYLTFHHGTGFSEVRTAELARIHAMEEVLGKLGGRIVERLRGDRNGH